jgi:hypothetical protein
MRLIGLFIVALLFVAGGCQTTTPRAEEPIAAAQTAAADPLQAAERWANDPTSRGQLDRPVETVVAGWSNPLVLRVWRDGDHYRALVADEDSDKVSAAVLLTLTSAEGWSVKSAEAARSDMLWPSL